MIIIVCTNNFGGQMEKYVHVLTKTNAFSEAH